MPVKTKRIYDSPEVEDGFRLLVMRRWPRGIAKAKISLWNKHLAPSTELLFSIRYGEITLPEYEKSYIREMTTLPESINAVKDLIRRSEFETITLMCACKDWNHCHRTLLKDLIANKI